MEDLLLDGIAIDDLDASLSQSVMSLVEPPPDPHAEKAAHVSELQASRLTDPPVSRSLTSDEDDDILERSDRASRGTA
jgi:hypothetical protein